MDASPDPATIGPFVVLRKLGEGAMGVVYAGYDVGLDRKVALKLVRRQLLHKARVRERMIREAQAMARLSNPHVVQVYQVGEHENGIYVAMEYVEGQTLGAWLKAERRPWPLVLRTICDAGRGLAAAHAAGLVHRDFKPDNVLIDTQGRARVLDFGLVLTAGAEPGGLEPPERSFDGLPADAVSLELSTNAVNIDSSNGLWSVRLTQLGNVMGTPIYMSPEQHFGQQAGPAADQFSFSITLFEALYGIRPFDADTWEGLRVQIRAGVVPQPPPLDSPVPRRVFRVLERGLSTEVGRRWPSLDAMIAALEHDPWRVRLRAAAMVSVIAVASTASYVVAMSQLDGGRCEANTQQLVGVWDPAREAAVSTAFAATHASFAPDALNRVKSRLDAYAQVLLNERQAACEAHESGAQTSRLLDLRSACLSRRTAHLAALVDVLAEADTSVVENAVQAVAALPGVAACSDEEALQLVPAPDDPEVAARVEQIRGQLARASALETTGKYEDALQLATRARGYADALGYGPLIAEAALSEGHVLMSVGRPNEADAALTRAVQVGIAHDLHAVAAEAAAIRIYIVGEMLGERSAALAAEPFAAALVDRAGGDPRLFALLRNNLGVVHHRLKNHEKAKSYYERSIAALRERSGPLDPLIAATQNNLANMLMDQANLDEAKLRFSESIELFSSMLGDNHPLVSHPLAGLADVELRQDRHVEALPDYRRALAIMEGSYGANHQFLLYVLPGLGRANVLAGRSEEAAQHFARAVAIAEKHAVRSREAALALEGLAELAGAKDQARGLYARAAEMFDESVGVDSEEGARTALRARELAAELKDGDAAP
ncbi:MAG: serine/threonine protein kinase [Nannocystis sp.]|nr:serine/threonine-protein kinase [Nannocystis sp.]MBA3547352.1 serine/threonine protein kinase [Nannocystis sp.]